MKILILSRRRTLYATRRLREEGRRAGHEIRVIDPLTCVLHLGEDGPAIRQGNRSLPRPDVVLPRIGTSGTDYGIAVVRHLQFMGVPSVNRHDAIARAKNKFECLQLLVAKGLKVPTSLLCRCPGNLDRILASLEGPPLVMKLLRGSQGAGVIFAENRASVESIFGAAWELGQDLILQRLIREAAGSDLRALVVGGRVRAAMRRTGPAGDFRSNIHRGGVGRPVRLSKACERAAVRAAASVGLRVAGVDLLESAEGPLVVEVNASPGFEGLEAATKRNIGRIILEETVRCAKKG